MFEIRYLICSNSLTWEQGGGFNWHSSISWQSDALFIIDWYPFLQRQIPCPSGVGWHICWSLHSRRLQASLHFSGSSSSLWGHSAWLLQTCPHVRQVVLFRHWKPCSQLTDISGIAAVRLHTYRQKYVTNEPKCTLTGTKTDSNLLCKICVFEWKF